MRGVGISPAGPDGRHRAVGEARVAQVAAAALQPALPRCSSMNAVICSISGPIIGALILFALQQTLSQNGAWYPVLVGGVAVVATLIVPRGLRGNASGRWGWSLLPVGYQVRDRRDEP